MGLTGEFTYAGYMRPRWVSMSSSGVLQFSILFSKGKIILQNEYWGDDGKAPQWRIDKQISNPIINI